jgi:hypothetical protein
MGNILGLEATSDSNFLKWKHPKSDKTGASKWKDIEDLINRWARRNPIGALMQEKWLKQDKETLFDKKNAKWAQDFNGEMGHISAEVKYSTLIHPELIEYLEVFYPDLFSTKESLHEFMIKFPKFKIRQRL